MCLIINSTCSRVPTQVCVYDVCVCVPHILGLVLHELCLKRNTLNQLAVNYKYEVINIHNLD